MRRVHRQANCGSGTGCSSLHRAREELDRCWQAGRRRTARIPRHSSRRRGPLPRSEQVSIRHVGYKGALADGATADSPGPRRHTCTVPLIAAKPRPARRTSRVGLPIRRTRSALDVGRGGRTIERPGGGANRRSDARTRTCRVPLRTRCAGSVSARGGRGSAGRPHGLAHPAREARRRRALDFLRGQSGRRGAELDVLRRLMCDTHPPSDLRQSLVRPVWVRRLRGASVTQEAGIGTGCLVGGRAAPGHVVGFAVDQTQAGFGRRIRW